MQAECIITGVMLADSRPTPNVIPLGVPGDLFVLGDTYIVNVNPNAEPMVLDEARARIIFTNNLAWERRAVYVIAVEDATLNQNAADYIQGK